MAYTAFWIAEAQAKLKNIPYFAGAQARKRTEDVAREQQSKQIMLLGVDRCVWNLVSRGNIGLADRTSKADG
jgi:hypothetical protein